jgi:hypothetical protein
MKDMSFGVVQMNLISTDGCSLASSLVTNILYCFKVTRYTHEHKLQRF